MKTKKSLFFLLLPAFALLFFNGVAPFIYTIYISFFDRSILRGTFNFIGLTNYITLFQDEIVLTSLSRTALFGIAALICEIPLGLALGFLLAKNFRGKDLFRAIAVLPLAMAPVVIGVVWKLLLNPDIGAITYVFRQFFGYQLNIGTSEIHAFWATVFVDVWHWTPFIGLVFLGGLMSIPNQLLEAADIDGAGFFRRLRYVILPNLKTTFALIGIIRIADIIRIYDEIFLLTNGGPSMATRYISLELAKEAIQVWNLGYASAISIILLIIIALLANGYLKLIRFE